MSLYLPYYIGKYNGDIPIQIIGSDADSYFSSNSLEKTAKVYYCFENETITPLKRLAKLCHDRRLDEKNWRESAKAVLEFMENNK